MNLPSVVSLRDWPDTLQFIVNPLAARCPALRWHTMATDSIKLQNSSGRELLLVIEPWASEFQLPAGSGCEVVSVGGTAQSVIEMEMLDDRIIFHIETAGAVYEYWQDGELVD